MMANSLQIAENMVKAFIEEVQKRTVSITGVNVVSADDLLSLLKLWGNNLDR